MDPKAPYFRVPKTRFDTGPDPIISPALGAYAYAIHHKALPKVIARLEELERGDNKWPNGDGDKTDCIGKDFGVLSSCNHTITTHGTFGHWVS